MKTFEELLEGLSKSNVNYILADGLAVDICGFSRATIDVDILIEVTEENIERLLNCLESFGEGSAKELKPEDFTLDEGSVRIVEEFPLDVFTLIKGHTYQDLLSDSDEFVTEKDIKIRYLNAEGLIKIKKESSRPKDKLDVQELKKIIGKN